jgi:hypothetical protein
MSNDVKKVRLRKLEENEVLGPMELADLKILAESAYISPGDEISFEGEEWQKAVLVDELGMHWMIRSKDGIEYGPTTVGTVREFLSAGEIEKEAMVINTKSKKEATVKEFLGDETLAKVEAEKQEQAIPVPDRDLDESLELAKDIRIRNLEVDYEGLKKEFDDLSQKYRRTSEELIALKKAT